jgi:membrane fusion protein (multidrug efflux system)
VDLPLAGRRGIPGVVQSLGHAARGPGQLFPVLVALPPGQPGVLPGMTAEVTLARTEREALVVPVGAVVNPTGSRPALFVVRQRRARRVPIEVQAVTGERLAVRPAPAAGGPTLAPGDRVVVAGQIGLIDDEPVRVARGATRRREVANR